MAETPESEQHMDIDASITAVDEEVINGNEALAPQLIPDIQNPRPSSDSSDSDSEEDESVQYIQIQTLETELSTNPSNYDSHVQYINLLRKMSLIHKLREAREAMNLLFPLTPEMWIQWAKDETSLLDKDSSESFAVIEKLYERGVSDYLTYGS